MKKALMVALTLLISVAFVSAVFAQAPAKPAEKPAAAPEKAPAPAPAPAKAPEKAPAPEKKAAEKPRTHQYTGEIVKLEVGKMIVLKGKDGEKSFDLGKVKVKDVKEGDKVVVKYTEKDGKMTASSVAKAKEKKPAEKKPAEAAKPAPEKAPAPAPAKPAEPAKK
jgi:hypothetical protein